MTRKRDESLNFQRDPRQWWGEDPSVLAHRAGLTLTQQAVAAKTNEIKEVETVFSQIVLTGRIVTMDALLTQRQVAQTIVEAGGDYIMIVKDNQPQLQAAIELVCTTPP